MEQGSLTSSSVELASRHDERHSLCAGACMYIKKYILGEIIQEKGYLTKLFMRRDMCICHDFDAILIEDMNYTLLPTNDG